MHAPGFYLHLEPGECMGGGGLWHPDAAALQKVRDRIVKRTKEWKAIVDRGIEISGHSLKRPPAGYAPTHPFIEDLKRKDIYTMTRFSEADVCAPDFLDHVLAYLAPRCGLVPDDEALRTEANQIQLTIADFVGEVHDPHLHACVPFA